MSGGWAIGHQVVLGFSDPVLDGQKLMCKLCVSLPLHWDDLGLTWANPVAQSLLHTRAKIK